MKYPIYTFIVVATQVAEKTEEIVEQTDFVGIWGILATIICCIMSCIVSYVLTMKSIRQLKITHSEQIIPILQNDITNNIKDFKVSYKNVVLKNPCILNLEIKNTGNVAIEDADIIINTKEEVEIIPGYIHNIESGYEEKWLLNKIDKFSSKIHLDYINPRQSVVVRFFLTDKPKNKISISCPMPNLSFQEIKGKSESTTLFGRFNPLQKGAIVLSIIFLIGVATMDYWFSALYDIIWHSNLEEFLVPGQIVLYVMAFFIGEITMCLIQVPSIDKFIVEHHMASIITEILFLLISVVGLYLIIFNWIMNVRAQIVVAVITLILLLLCVYIQLARSMYK